MGIRHGLAGFIPADVRFALARGETLADRGRGSVLEADVSSFTPLTESLARRGAGDAVGNLRAYARVFAIGAPARWLYQAERDRRLGRTEGAVAAWRKALAAAEALEMRHELALAHAALGDHLPDGPARESHRALGEQILTELGAPAATRAVTPR